MPCHTIILYYSILCYIEVALIQNTTIFCTVNLLVDHTRPIIAYVIAGLYHTILIYTRLIYATASTTGYGRLLYCLLVYTILYIS